MVCIFKASSQACPLPRGHRFCPMKKLELPSCWLMRDHPDQRWGPTHMKEPRQKKTSSSSADHRWMRQPVWNRKLPRWVQPSLTTADAGKDGRHEEAGTKEDEMVGWHHRLNGHEFERTPGDSEGQGSLACCSSWGCKELDMTEQQKKSESVAKELLFKASTFCDGLSHT